MTLRKRKGMEAGLRYQFKTKPYRHQFRALKKLLAKRGGFLNMEMGTGKSKVAIDFACAAHLKWGVDRVVIVGPKSVTSAVWRLQIKLHAPPKIRRKIKWIIINYEKLPDIDRTVGDEEFTYEGKKHILRKFLGEGPSVLICDECHLLKTPSAARSKAVYYMRQMATFVVMLTGTPITKNVLDAYQQFKIFDEHIFGTNFAHFKKRYAVFGGYGNYELLRYINLRHFKKVTKPWIFIAKKDDCLDLPARTDQIVPIRLTGKAKEHYKQMEKEGLLELNGDEIETEIILTRILRLQQISSGFLPTSDGQGIHRFNSDKLVQYERDLADFKDQELTKFVTFCQFIPDIKACAKAAKEAGYNILLFHGGVSGPEREQRLAEFDETDEPTAFICQNAAGALGISLTAASTAVLFSHTTNYAEKAQLKDRLHRIGQHHPVTYREYIARGVDQAIWMGYRAKKDVADLLWMKPELLMQKGIDLR